MTVDTLVATPVVLPRVNLLPQEINEAGAARRAKGMLVVALVTVVAGVGFAYVSAGNTVTGAQADLEKTQATTAKLNQDVAKHSAITPLKRNVEVRTQLLKDAMAMHIPWSFYLNDVQRLPRGARLVTWQFALTPPAAGADATAFGSGGVATWTITGEAKRFEDVALVAESLQALDEVDSVLITQATEFDDTVSGETLIQFALTARMNAKAPAPYSPKVGG